MGKGAGSTMDVNGTVDIDDGTLARTDTPAPGTIGLDAHSGGSSHASPSVSVQVLGYARRHNGQRVGNGECATFANGALQAAHAKSNSDYGSVTDTADYIWGTATTLANLQPGDIIQFRDYSFREDVTDSGGATRWHTEDRPHHTAIVQSVDGDGAVTVLEQNSPKGSPVRRKQLFFTSRTTTSGGTTTAIMVSGTFWFYHPEAR
jgi:hypothetical protein